jgi:hypothetical protein
VAKPEHISDGRAAVESTLNDSIPARRGRLGVEISGFIDQMKRRLALYSDWVTLIDTGEGAELYYWIVIPGSARR